METIGELLSRSAIECPNRPFLRFQGRSLSFGDVDRAATDAARRLMTLGVGHGDRVALLLPNGFDYPIHWLALAKLGAIAVPANIQYRRNDLAYVLTDAGVMVVVTTAAFADTVEEARQLARARWIIGLTDDERAGTIDLRGVAPSPDPLPTVAVDDLLNLQYTSGTTGFPKGCMLTHRYWHAMGSISVPLMTVTDADVVISAQPCYYIDPHWTLLMCLIARVPMVILPRFSASTFWASASREGATLFYCVGTMPNMLASQPPGPDDRRHKLRLVYCSGIDPARHAEFEARWGVPWREAFGMTETGCDIGVAADDAASVGTGTIGVPLGPRRAAILSPEGMEVPAGEIGELCLTGGTMMLGYWNKPEATAEAFRGGWFHTGDLARRDKAGRYYLVGRIKDMIRRGGENVAAVEVEQSIAAHPAVAGVAVTSRPDPIRGEEVEAFVLPKPGAELDPEDLNRFLEGRIAAFKRPRFITLVRDFPLTPSERVEKHRLRVAGNPHVLRSYDGQQRRWLD